MSKVTSLSVSSTPAIRFRWEGTRGEAVGAVQPASEVTLPDGTITSLAGWTEPATTTITPLSSGGAAPAVEVVLGPSAGASFQPQTEQLVKILFKFDHAPDAPAAAIVDAPYGQVINSIAGPGAPGPGIAGP